MNYKGNLLKTKTQTRFETAPGLEIHDIRILNKFETGPGLENHEIRILNNEL